MGAVLGVGAADHEPVTKTTNIKPRRMLNNMINPLAKGQDNAQCRDYPAPAGSPTEKFMRDNVNGRYV
jgi:hypothetical protein